MTVPQSWLKLKSSIQLPRFWLNWLRLKMSPLVMVRPVLSSLLPNWWRYVSTHAQWSPWWWLCFVYNFVFCWCDRFSHLHVRWPLHSVIDDHPFLTTCCSFSFYFQCQISSHAPCWIFHTLTIHSWHAILWKWIWMLWKWHCDSNSHPTLETAITFITNNNHHQQQQQQ